jgi:hypothetical protein
MHPHVTTLVMLFLAACCCSLCLAHVETPTPARLACSHTPAPVAASTTQQAAAAATCQMMSAAWCVAGLLLVMLQLWTCCRPSVGHASAMDLLQAFCWSCFSYGPVVLSVVDLQQIILKPTVQAQQYLMLFLVVQTPSRLFFVTSACIPCFITC